LLISLNITVLSSKNHPIYPILEKWCRKNSEKHNFSLISSLEEVSKGDILFLISFTKIVKNEIREKFKKTLVIHASDLPNGKGWSPHIWEILKGKNKITLTLFEAVNDVDAGDIWKKLVFSLKGHELYKEINEKLFLSELELMDYAINNFDSITPTPQPNISSEYLQKRNPEDSEINPQKSIADQFDLIRICDDERYPCFFNFRNHKYKLTLSKI
jgi:methionyl-tRNA formyltransferase